MCSRNQIMYSQNIFKCTIKLLCSWFLFRVVKELDHAPKNTVYLINSRKEKLLATNSILYGFFFFYFFPSPVLQVTGVSVFQQTPQVFTVEPRLLTTNNRLVATRVLWVLSFKRVHGLNCIHCNVCIGGRVHRHQLLEVNEVTRIHL